MKLILENLIHFRATSIVVNFISFSAVTAKVSQQGKCNKDGKGTFCFKTLCDSHLATVQGLVIC